jgi:phospholipase/carboxylesterase
MKLLDTVEVATGPSPTASVIWMHGLGADGHDFEPIVGELVPAHERAVRFAVRFVFPHAPMRAVTANAGYVMRAWYDIAALGAHAREDLEGLRGARAQIEALIERELERGVAHEHIALAGFSQGGALALYTGTRYAHRLAGIVGLSCYLPAADQLTAEHSSASLATPIFMAHGSQDPLVLASYGEESRRALERNGYSVQWHLYPMAHTVSPEEIVELAAWLRRVL